MRLVSIFLLSTGLVTGAASAAFAEEGPLVSTLQAYKITVDADGKEQLTATEEAVPGDLLEYRIEYENTGDGALSSVVVRIPVPSEMEFVADSERASVSSIFEASINGGGDWAKEPLKEMVEGEMKEINPTRYTNIRWIPAQQVAAGEKMTFSYRAEVE